MSAVALSPTFASPLGWLFAPTTAPPGRARPRLAVRAGAAMSEGVRLAATPEDMSARVQAIARHRDKAAFAALFQFYAPRVKSYLMRHGADESQAEELSQETLLNVWRKADSFDASKASAGTWIFTIARNLRIDALRRARWPQVDQNDPAFIPDGEAQPDDALSNAQMRVRIRDAISQLPPEQSAVIHKSFFEDKAHSEIAAELALPLGTVKSRLRRAMQRVKSLVEPS